MSTTKKPTGIIYRAYNTVSEKSYVGKSMYSIERRRKQHYTTAKKVHHKFANALCAYEKDVWVWSVLKQVPVEELNYYEKFFIDDLDTYHNGYNTLNGNEKYTDKKRTPYEKKVLELYHKDYGLVVGLQFEILQIEPRLYSHLYKLLNKTSLSRCGWVLAENKDRYDEIMDIHEFYHPEIGIVKCTSGELNRDYIIPSILDSEKKPRKLAINLTKVSRPNKYCHGWMLLKNKEEFDTKEIVVTHKIHGTHTLFREEFVSRFNLNPTGVTKLIIGSTKSYLGWKLVEERNEKSN